MTRLLLPGAIFRADAAQRQVYLTFDDGPDPEVTPKLLDILGAENASATFFVLASEKKWWEELIVQISARGHRVALHGRQHRSALRRGNSVLRSELGQLAGAISRAGAKPLPAFRPPFGNIRPDTVRYLLHHGIATILWTGIPGDFRLQAQDILFRRACQSLQPGSILALHDGTHLRPAPVLELTRRLLRHISDLGWTCAALHEQELNLLPANGS